MTEQITAQKMLQVLQEVVDEAGEGYVYEAPDDGSCKYVDHNGGCLIGRALTVLGVSSSTLEQMDGFQSTDISSCLFSLNYAIDGLTFTPATQGLMRRVQSEQDVGVSWGKCLQAGRKYLEDNGDDQ